MLETLLKDVQIAATICLQYGDTGKGKIAHWLATWADFNARGTGGANAGHTIIVNGHEVVHHLLPVGITYDGLGKKTLLGGGMVIDPNELCHELDEIVSRGGTHNNLIIDEDAGVVMPWHISRDVVRNKSQSNGGIGSTGRGIGPCYADKVARIGITMRDILSSDSVVRKLDKIREAYPEQVIDSDLVVNSLDSIAERLRQYIANGTNVMHEAIKSGKKIHLEGAQGTLLSVNHGIFPYVTSSDCAINGTAAGVGISAKAVDLVLGILKTPFMTRVGGGPFPTEFGGKDSEEYCARTTAEGKPYYSKIAELTRHEIPNHLEGEKVVYDLRDPKIIALMNSHNSFLRGVGIRLAGNEYGATTARPRRVGWTDAVAALYACDINRPLRLVMTKPDSVAGIEDFKICYGYRYGRAGSETDEFSRDSVRQKSILPVYKSYAGYGSIDGARTFDQLPTSLKTAIWEIERFTRASVAVVSVGPGREQTIVV